MEPERKQVVVGFAEEEVSLLVNVSGKCNAVLQFTIHIEPGGFTVVGIDDRIPLAFLMNSPGRGKGTVPVPRSSGAGYRRCAAAAPAVGEERIIEAQGIITGL